MPAFPPSPSSLCRADSVPLTPRPFHPCRGAGSGRIDIGEFTDALGSIGFAYNESQILALFGRWVGSSSTHFHTPCWYVCQLKRAHGYLQVLVAFPGLWVGYRLLCSLPKEYGAATDSLCRPDTCGCLLVCAVQV